MNEIFVFILGVVVGMLINRFIYVENRNGKKRESSDGDTNEIEDPLVP